MTERIAQQKQWDVAELECKGRGVVSTAAIAGGSTVLFEARPLAFVVHASRALQACSACACLRLSDVSTRFLAHNIVCTQCQQAAWCSEECRNQSSVAGTHPVQICHAYRRLAEMAAEANAAARAKEHAQASPGPDAGANSSSAAASSPSSDASVRAAVLQDPETLSDARLLFYAYLFRRYRADDFARWSLLCSLPEPASRQTAASSALVGGSCSSSSTATSAASSAAPASPEAMEEEARIEALHDIVVECLQYAANMIAAPTPLPASATPASSASPPELKALPSFPASATTSPPAQGGAPAASPTEATPPSAAAMLPPPPLSLPRLAKQFTDLHISHPTDDLTSSLAADADLPVTRACYLKAQCNAMALSAPHDKIGNRQTPRGYAIYTSAAMFNHSCMPNVARFDRIDSRDIKWTKGGAKGAAAASSSSATSAASASADASSSCSVAAALTPSPSTCSPSPLAPSPSDCPSSSSFTPLSLELRALHAVPPYTELTLSYVPLFWDRRDRQEQFKAEFAFRCRCPRCRLEKRQEREERERGEQGEDEEHEHDHDHGEEDEEDDEDEDGEGGEDDEEEDGSDLSEDSDAEGGDAAAAAASDSLTSGELNVYLTKYICPLKTCGGTLAPLQPGSASALSAPAPLAGPRGAALGGHMECNTCGKVRTDVQFQRQLQKVFGERK